MSHPFIIVALVIASTLVSQLPGTWETFADATHSQCIAAYGGKIYAGTGGGIVVYEPGNGITQIMTNLDGLYGMDIVSLVVADNNMYYASSNGAIGRLDGDKWRSYSDLVREDIRINDMIFTGENLYIATEMGISKLNILDGPSPVEITENYTKLADFERNMSVTCLTADDTVIWAGMELGIAWSRLEANLFVPDVWRTMQTDRPVTAIFADSGGVWFSVEQSPEEPTVFWTNGERIDTVHDSFMDNRKLDDFFYYNDELHTTGKSGLFVYDNPNDFDRIQVENHGAVHSGATLNDSLYVGLEVGIGVLSNDTIRYYEPNCPCGTVFDDLAFTSDGGVWIVSKGVGMSFYKDGVWTRYKYKDIGAQPGDSVAEMVGKRIFRAAVLELDPDGTLWIGTNRFGVIRLSPDGEWEIFDHTNSILTGFPDNEDSVLCRALTYDDYNDVMWVTNYDAVGHLVAAAFYPNNALDIPIVEYYQGAVQLPNNHVLDVAAGFGYLWLVLRDAGVTLIDLGASLSDKSDDYMRNFDDTNNELPSASAFAVALDSAGNAWIAAAGGVATIYPTLGYSYVHTLPENMSAGVTDIAVDSWNDVWIATDKGAGMFRSADSSWHLLSTRLSPNAAPDERTDLATELLYAVGVHPITGDIWFCGENAISVLHTSQVFNDGKSRELVAYPNPFVWKGLASERMTIVGVPPDADLQIYSPDGALVRTIELSERKSTVAVLWDGRNDAGLPVASGVYVLVAPSSAGIYRGKAALIRAD